MANNRLYYSISQLGIKGDGAATGYHAIHGVQSAGMTTNFGLTPVAEFGQQEPYANLEEIPTIDITASKCLDGYPLIWHEATINASAPTLAGRSTSKCLLSIAYFDESLSSATGTPSSQVATSGVFVTSLRYQFPLQGPFREEVGFQCNNKVWANDPRMVQSAPWLGATGLNFTGAFSTTDSPIGSGGINRRQNLNFSYSGSYNLDTAGMAGDPDATILPPEIYGISSSGTNDLQSNGSFSAHIGDITASVDLRREDTFEQGRRGPYAKNITFPVETTCEITATAVSGDMVSATEAGILSGATGRCVYGTNLADRTIRIATCEGTRVYLGTKCKLATVALTGGDAAGGNVQVSYTFRGQNIFTVLHSGDPNANGSTWWSSRATYLVT